MEPREINGFIIDRFDKRDIRGLFELFDTEGNNFNAINISTLLNRLSKLIPPDKYVPYKDKIQRVAVLIHDKASEFQAQGIANILNAFSKWETSKNKPYSDAMLALVKRIPTEISDFGAQHIANVLNAFSKWETSKNKPYSDAMLALVKRIPTEINDFGAQEIANTLNAFSKWKTSADASYSDAILALVKHIPTKINDFSVQHIANTLNAFSKWEASTHAPYSAIITCLFKRAENEIITNNAPDQLPVIALAYCLLDFGDSSNKNETPCSSNQVIITTLIGKYKNEIINNLTPLAARQIYQIYLYKKALIPTELIARARTLTEECFAPEEVAPSNLQRKLTQYVENLFNEINWKKEYVIAFTRVDIACVEKKLVLQINGPTHYDGDCNALNRQSRFNQHLLEKLGWNVIIIPYYEWEKLNNENMIVSYLNNKIASDHAITQKRPKKRRASKKPYQNEPQSSKKGDSLKLNHANANIPNIKKSLDDPFLNKKTMKSARVRKNVLQKNSSAESTRSMQTRVQINEKTLESLWEDVIKKNYRGIAIKESVRPDELVAAYDVVKSAYQQVFKKNGIKNIDSSHLDFWRGAAKISNRRVYNRHEDGELSGNAAKNSGAKGIKKFKDSVRRRLEYAFYKKSFELLSPKTILAFFRRQPYSYGLRLDAVHHPTEAFTKDAIQLEFCLEIIANRKRL